MKLLAWVARVGSGGMILAGGVGAPVMANLGPPLAMGLAIWSGQTTEPLQPSLDYPWMLTLGMLAVWLWAVRRPAGHWAIAVLVQVSAAGVALLPWLHLGRLWARVLE